MNTHIVFGKYPYKYDQPGISIRNGFISQALLHFDISKLPKNAIINNATLTIVPDTLTSKYGSVFSAAIRVYNSSDTANFTPVESASTTLNSTLKVFSANVQSLVNTDYSTGKNVSFILRNDRFYNGVERMNFFGATDAIFAKRPLLKIYYSVRGN